MRLSLTRRLLLSGPRRPFWHTNKSHTTPDHHQLSSKSSWAIRSYRTAQPLDATARTTYGKQTQDGVSSTPASLAEALQEEEIMMKSTDEQLSNSIAEDADDPLEEDFLRPSYADRKDPDAWMLLLEQFLPKELQITSEPSNLSPLPPARARAYILKILKLKSAQPNVPRCDLLVHMGVQHGRWKAVSWLGDLLLRGAATRALGRSTDEMPSNIVWPSLKSFDQTDIGRRIEPDVFTPTRQPAATQWFHHDLDPRYSDSMSNIKDDTMAQIWSSLGCIIIESKEMAEEDANQAMSVVYKILGQIHNSDLIPDNVYSYMTQGHTSSVKRPAILHLLSSRILSTLSDAVWRSHQDEAIAQAARSGAEYKDISNDPPGGRFRLKVRPLGPEVWLEFVLWCCADGGFTAAGLHIIELMQQNTTNPWFSVNWTSNGEARIDWARVMQRHGGTVGQIEGYSSERPFAEMQPRTVSSEVVLSLIESTVNSVKVGLRYRGIEISRTIRAIKSFMGFLEPHSLPLHYFDYLAVRLAQTGAFDMERDPREFLSLTNMISSLRALDTTVEEPRLEPSLDFDYILLQSELHSGLLHQCLDGLVVYGDIRTAINTFSSIQESVDNSKLKSIFVFLSTSTDEDGNAPAPVQFSSALEYVRSHGQLPPYKMGGFLNLVTDSRLTRLGRWLIYSEDVDGPPISADKHTSLSAPLLRFAALTNDWGLLHTVTRFHRSSDRKPSISFLRAKVDADIAMLDLRSAVEVLTSTMSARAGGYRPANLAQIFAMIMGLESETILLENGTDSQKFIAELVDLAQRILNGSFDGNVGDFTLQQVASFRREVGCILVVANSVPSATLNPLAATWRDIYSSGDGVSLGTSTFNMMLSAAVDSYGALEGQRLWELFCLDPRDRFNPENVLAQGMLLVPEIIEEGGDGADLPSVQYVVREDTRKIRDYVPLVTVSMPDLKDTTPEAGFTETEAPEMSSSILSLGSSFASTGFGGVSIRAAEPPAQGDAQAETPTPGGPLVMPNLRTLRLIVRGAQKEEALEPAEKLRLMRWAAGLFRGGWGMKGDLVDAEVGIERVLGFASEKDGDRKSGGRARERGVQREDVGGLFRGVGRESERGRFWDLGR